MTPSSNSASTILDLPSYLLLWRSLSCSADSISAFRLSTAVSCLVLSSSRNSVAIVSARWASSLPLFFDSDRRLRASCSILASNAPFLRSSEPLNWSIRSVSVFFQRMLRSPRRNPRLPTIDPRCDLVWPFAFCRASGSLRLPSSRPSSIDFHLPLLISLTSDLRVSSSSSLSSGLLLKTRSTSFEAPRSPSIESSTSRAPSRTGEDEEGRCLKGTEILITLFL